MKNFTNYTIDKNVKCLDALRKLDQGKSNETLFVLDSNSKLLGTVTDGDVRRGFLSGLSLDDPIHKFCHLEFVSINNHINVSIIPTLKKNGIKSLPKLNEKGQIERVYDLSKLHSILPVHALIMAGGKGERLRPLTDKTPKPLLPLGNKPIIEHNIDQLISYGIDTITISVRYLSEQIMEYFGDGSSKGITINYIEETEPLGTIGCLSKLENIEQETVLVLNSDLFTNIDYHNFFIDFEKEDADMAVASTPYSVDIPYAIMELEESNITDFKEKPRHTYYANAGIYLIKKHAISSIPKNTHFNATDLMEKLISNNSKLIHSPISGYWIDIGKPDDYKKAKEIIRHQ